MRNEDNFTVIRYLSIGIQGPHYLSSSIVKWWNNNINTNDETSFQASESRSNDSVVWYVNMRKCIACVLEGRPAGLVEVILLKAVQVAIVHWSYSRDVTNKAPTGCNNITWSILLIKNRRGSSPSTMMMKNEWMNDEIHWTADRVGNRITENLNRDDEEHGANTFVGLLFFSLSSPFEFFI